MGPLHYLFIFCGCQETPGMETKPRPSWQSAGKGAAELSRNHLSIDILPGKPQGRLRPLPHRGIHVPSTHCGRPGQEAQSHSPRLCAG